MYFYRRPYKKQLPSESGFRRLHPRHQWMPDAQHTDVLLHSQYISHGSSNFSADSVKIRQAGMWILGQISGTVTDECTLN